MDYADGSDRGEARALNHRNPLTLYHFIFGPVFFHPTVVYRRDWITSLRYDRAWGNGQDRELWIRGRGSRYGNLSEPYLKYRVRPSDHSVYRSAFQNKKVLVQKYSDTLFLKVLLFPMLGVEYLKVKFFQIRKAP